jgi:hypothetical protein
MTRSKFSTKAIVLAAAIGLSTVAFAGSQPAAAQSYACPAGLAYDPSYGCGITAITATPTYFMAGTLTTAPSIMASAMAA